MKSLDRSRKTTLGAGCMVLFTLPFLGFGGFMLWLAAQAVYDWQRMQSWEARPATILEVDLRHGEDAVELQAEYQYEYEGRTYTASRVAVHTGSDNIGRFQRRKHAQLEQAHDLGKPVTCYVDPENPEQAVLFRDMRAEMVAFKGMFALVFGGVGLGGLVGSVWWRKKQAAQSTEKAKYPSKPWMWRREWQEDELKSTGGGSAAALVVFALLWNAIAWTVAGAFLLDDQASEWWVKLLVALFPLVGIGLVVAAAFALVRWWRFRGVRFRMAKVPGVIGGGLAGVVLIPQRIRPAEGFRLVLSCIRRESDGEHSTDRVLWQDERLVVRTLDDADPSDTAVPVAFTIPSDVPPTDVEADAPVRWKLKVVAELRGANLDTEFEVPVYRTEESQEGIVAEDLLDGYEKDESLYDLLVAQGIRVAYGPSLDQVRFEVPPGRNRGMATFLTLFTLGWSAVVVGLFWGELWWIAAVFAVFDVVLWYLTLHTWLAASEVEIRGDRWRVASGWWPLFMGRHEFSPDQIRRIEVKNSASSGDKQYNNLLLHLEGGKALTLARGLTSRRAERIWLAELRQRAGLA